jgi:hypothetical protein
MPTNETHADVRMNMHASAELQEHLLAATQDLAHLQCLLTHACETLTQGFVGVTEQLQSLIVVKPENSAAIARAVQHLGSTARALQFQDMSTQLINHTRQRLQHCADQVASQAFGADDDDGQALVEAAPQRPNPVTQSEMHAGLIELF